MEYDHIEDVSMSPLIRYHPLHPSMRYMIDNVPNFSHQEEPFIHPYTPAYVNALYNLPPSHLRSVASRLS